MYGRDLKQIETGDPRPPILPHVIQGIQVVANKTLGYECGQMCSYMSIFA